MYRWLCTHAKIFTIFEGTSEIRSPRCARNRQTGPTGPPFPSPSSTTLRTIRPARSLTTRTRSPHFVRRCDMCQPRRHRCTNEEFHWRPSRGSVQIRRCMAPSAWTWTPGSTWDWLPPCLAPGHLLAPPTDHARRHDEGFPGFVDQAPDPRAGLAFAYGHLPLDEHDVDVDGDRHQLTSFGSACICAASASGASSGGAPAAL